MDDPHNRPVLRAGDITLRAPEMSDAPARQRLGRSAEILRTFGADVDPDAPYTPEMAEDWVRQNRDDPLGFVIEHDGTLAGFLRLHSVEPHDRRAIVAIGLLDEAKLGQGIGTRALHLILTHAFGTMGLHRVSLRVLDYNTRAIASYTKLGFVKEGCLRQNALVDGGWHNDVIMGLLAEEFTP